MPTKPRLKIRCSEEQARDWKQACGAFDLTYGEMVQKTAKFVLENPEAFERFVYEDERERE